MIPEEATSFEVVDLRTSDTIASFSDFASAEEAFLALVEEIPAEARYLAMVFFDKTGAAIGSRLADEFSPA